MLKNLVRILPIILWQIVSSCHGLGNVRNTKFENSTESTSSLLNNVDGHSHETENLDTIYKKVVIGTGTYSVKVINRFDAGRGVTVDNDTDNRSLSFVFSEEGKSSSVFKQDIKSVFYWFFKASGKSLSDSGPLFLSELNYGYGSGFLSTLHCIVQDGNSGLRSEELFKSTELDICVFAKNDSAVLLLKGLGNKEAHLGPQRYKMVQYLICNGKFACSTIGTTTYQYQNVESASFAELFKEIAVKEPKLTSKITLNQYDTSSEIAKDSWWIVKMACPN